jgi:hypothetical protein
MGAALIFVVFVQAYTSWVLPGSIGRSLLAGRGHFGAAGAAPRNSTLSQQWNRLQQHVSQTAQHLQALKDAQLSQLGELRELRDGLKHLRRDMVARLAAQQNQTEHLDAELASMKEASQRLAQDVERLAKKSSSWLSLNAASSSSGPMGVKPVSKYDAGNSSLGGWIRGWQPGGREGEQSAANGTSLRSNSSEPQAWAKKAIAWIMPARAGNESASSFLWFVGGRNAGGGKNEQGNGTEFSNSSNGRASLEAMAERTRHRFSNRTNSLVREAWLNSSHGSRQQNRSGADAALLASQNHSQRAEAYSLRANSARSGPRKGPLS